MYKINFPDSTDNYVNDIKSTNRCIISTKVDKDYKRCEKKATFRLNTDVYYIFCEEHVPKSFINDFEQLDLTSSYSRNFYECDIYNGRDYCWHEAKYGKNLYDIPDRCKFHKRANDVYIERQCNSCLFKNVDKPMNATYGITFPFYCENCKPTDINLTDFSYGKNTSSVNNM